MFEVVYSELNVIPTCFVKKIHLEHIFVKLYCSILRFVSVRQLITFLSNEYHGSQLSCLDKNNKRFDID